VSAPRQVTEATRVRPRVLERVARHGIDPMDIAREYGAE
jgi:hypothetical protein